MNMQKTDKQIKKLIQNDNKKLQLLKNGWSKYSIKHVLNWNPASTCIVYLNYHCEAQEPGDNLPRSSRKNSWTVKPHVLWELMQVFKPEKSRARALPLFLGAHAWGW
jgi:hypothetical protein